MRQFAAVGDGAVEVVGAEMEGGLGRGLAEHDPVGLDVIEVVQYQTRDRDRFEIVDRVRSWKRRERRSRRIECERDEALKTACLVLLFAKLNEMIDAVLDR